jgi:L-lactate utilization protein LutB
MSPEEQKELDQHTKAIARILYKNTPKEELTSLGKIEEAVRARMQKYVMPEVGIAWCNAR